MSRYIGDIHFERLRNFWLFVLTVCRFEVKGKGHRSLARSWKLKTWMWKAVLEEGRVM